MKRILSILLSISLIVCAFAGCSSKEKTYNFIYPFSANVNSYDPQVAATGDEYLIIENCFEGLVRVNDDGTILPAVADKWDISADGLTYTFYIHKGLKWDINTDKYQSGDKKGEFKDSRLKMLGYEFNPDITANDFVFALQRAVSPITNCPLFSSIACIKGATEINSGKAKMSALGVKALDEFTLEIKLKSKDDAFMQTLASAVAIPCNKEFFEATKGRYGLEAKYTIFNGQFYVSQILENSYLLKASKQYNGVNPTKASQLTLKILDGTETKGDTISKLESGYYDAGFISGSDSDSINKKSGVSYTPYQDTTWAFVLNTNDEALQSKTLRKAFCEGFSKMEKYDKDYLQTATNLIPSSCTINSNLATSAIGNTVTKENQTNSVKDWKKALTILGTTNIEIKILTPESMQNYVKEMLQGVQSGIGSNLKNEKGQIVSLSLKVETMEESDIRVAVAKNEYDIAFLPFKAQNNSAITFIDQVAEGSIGGFDRDKVSSYVKKAQNKESLTEISKELKLAEKEIINSYSICPTIYESSYYALANGIKGVQFHPGTGRVSFVNATSEK